MENSRFSIPGMETYGECRYRLVWSGMERYDLSEQSMYQYILVHTFTSAKIRAYSCHIPAQHIPACTLLSCFFISAAPSWSARKRRICCGLITDIIKHNQVYFKVGFAVLRQRLVLSIGVAGSGARRRHQLSPRQRLQNNLRLCLPAAQLS